MSIVVLEVNTAQSSLCSVPALELKEEMYNVNTENRARGQGEKKGEGEGRERERSFFYF